MGLFIFGEFFTDGFGGFDTVHFGHMDIHEDEVVVLFLEGLEDFEAVVDGGDIVAHAG